MTSVSTIVGNDGFLVTIGFELRTSGHKTKAVALSKRVLRLFSAIVSSYAVCSEMVLATSGNIILSSNKCVKL